MIQAILSLVLVLQTAAGGISGTVVDDATGQPVAGARLAAVRLPTMGPRGRSPTETIQRVPPQTTDSAGRFAFQNLALGDYIVTIAAEGYGDGSFVGRTPQSNGMPVTLTEREASRIVSFRLVRGSAISGRVVGASGEPLGNMEVSLFLHNVTPDGRSSYSQAMVTATNDRGEYRLVSVKPGKYSLSAGPPTRPIQNVPTSIPINNPKNRYPRLFHPGVTEISAAAVIDVRSGGEFSGLDFRMTEQPTFRIKGRVIDTVTGQLSPNVSISITARNSNLILGGFASAAILDPRDGSFDLQYITPGSYLIRAMAPSPLRGGTARPPGTAELAAAAVEVLNRDVDDVVLSFRPLLSLTGRVRMENGAPPPADLRVNVVLGSSMPPLPTGPRTLQWNSDGTFRIDGIEPGEYRVSISPVRASGAAGVLVREAWSGPVNLLKEPLLLTDPRPDEIVVTLSATGR